MYPYCFIFRPQPPLLCACPIHSSLHASGPAHTNDLNVHNFHVQVQSNVCARVLGRQSYRCVHCALWHLSFKIFRDYTGLESNKCIRFADLGP